MKHFKNMGFGMGIPALAVCLVAVCLVAGARAAPVETENGLVQGIEETGVTVFKGVPFAAPPVGALRWRAPRPVAAWSGIRPADQFPPACMQDWADAYPAGSPPEPVGEDCLYLNIWKPAAPSADPLPVMVWIYGGSLENGSASTPIYAGDRLATRHVILVTLNYRLGSFGFLAHPDLSREAPQHTSGNYGLLDQIAALNWVHRNIAAFGGDPRRVTIFGQSSGGDSVSALVTSPLAAGLFQRAIGESGGAFEPFETRSDLTLAGAEKIGQAFVRESGAASLAELRLRSAADILKLNYQGQIIVDGFVLPRAPYDTYRQGKQNDVDILVGSNADEGNLFGVPRHITVAHFRQDLAGDGFPGILQWLLGVKPGASDQEARHEADRFETDMRFRWDMWAWAGLAADHGRGKVFYYQFARVPPFRPGERYFGWGATHGMELYYVFDHLDQEAEPWTAEDRRLASVIPAYWTNFAATGDPNGPGLPPWPAFRSARGTAMTLGDVITPEPIANEAALRRIDRLYATVRLVIGYPYALGAAAIVILLCMIAGPVIMLRRRCRAGF